MNSANHQIFGLLASAAGIRPQVFAAGTIRALDTLNAEHPQSADRILWNLFALIQPLLLEGLMRARQNGQVHVCMAAILIEAYFADSGNWKRMEQSVREKLPIRPHDEQLVAEIASALISDSRRREAARK